MKNNSISSLNYCYMSYTYCYFIHDLRRLTLEQSRAERRLPFVVAQRSL